MFMIRSIRQSSIQVPQLFFKKYKMTAIIEVKEKVEREHSVAFRRNDLVDNESVYIRD